MRSPPAALTPVLVALWQAFSRWVGEDASLALLLLLSLASGGTDYPLSVRLICPRGTDGRALVETLLALLRRLQYRWNGKVVNVTHATTAAIFAAKRVAAIIADLDHVSPALAPLISEMRLQGRAECWIRDENGRPNRLKVVGPTAVIQIVGPDQEDDLTEDPTWLTCRLNDADEQITFLANAVIDGFDQRNGTDHLAGLATEVSRVLNLPGVRAKQRVRNRWNYGLATTSARPSHLPAAIQHVARLAALIALARFSTSPTAPGDLPTVVDGARDDVTSALALILDCNAVDDRETAREKHLHLLGWLRHMELGSPPLPLNQIVRMLNTGAFWKVITAANEADPSRHLPVAPSHIIWTRRIVERGLKALLNAGLVERDASHEPYLWRLALSATLYRPSSLFALMASAMESTTHLSAVIHSGSTVADGQTICPATGTTGAESQPSDRDDRTTGEAP